MILDAMQKVAQLLPEVKSPTSPPPVKERAIWTVIALVLFFVMYNITVFGATMQSSALDFLQVITAAKIGSLLTTGIGPLVLASIFLQLFAGAKIINLDMSNPEDKKKFHQVQKVLAIIIALFEATLFVTNGTIPISQQFGMILPLLAVFQIAFGSIILLYLDEIISKYGIGSGISLFIAAGVSLSVIGGLAGLIVEPGGVIDSLTGGGAEGIPKAILALLPFVFSILVFIGVVYAESVKVEIPIAYERVRGLVPKLPLKLMYVSNIPVIFASALLMNMRAITLALQNITFDVGGFNVVLILQEFLYLISPIYAGGSDTLTHFNYIMTATTPYLAVPEYVHAFIYVLFLSLLSIVFGIFWAETSNMDAKSVAKQLGSSGMQVPGFRRDPRMLERILEKHIFPLTVLGSFLVGLLAGVADLTGALGTGTGILLTVGILYRMYEQLKQMKVTEMYPSLGSFLS
ncbi:preprotein translocase subunit SecY [Candidatus Micrarchaeota archaeon]|nr:preprotein translocase subunit SecY [Candidatus Micrarchaeota archaeon]